MAPLFPKLRGHFAEFLNNASPVGLRLFALSTCVGLRYGSDSSHSGFSWQCFRLLRYFISLRITPALPPGGFASPATPVLSPAFHCRLRLLPCVPAVLYCRSTGFSTCPPSPTRLRLSLGPGLPRVDQLYPGNLGYPAWMIPTSISLLIPAFSLHAAPPLLAGTASPLHQCSPTSRTAPQDCPTPWLR